MGYELNEAGGHIHYISKVFVDAYSYFYSYFGFFENVKIKTTIDFIG
jgi:hypothetical protein